MLIIDSSLILDLAFLILLIMPLLILSLKYLTYHPFHSYDSKLNALLGPIFVLPMFFFSNYDILYMSLLVGPMNIYVAYRQLESDESSFYEFYKEQKAKSQSNEAKVGINGGEY